MIDILTITQFTNTESGGVLFLALTLVIGAIAFIGSLANGRQAYRGFIFASFICTILSVILGLLGLLQSSYIYLFIILLGFGIVWTLLVRSKG